MANSIHHPEFNRIRAKLKHIIYNKGYTSVEKFAHEHGIEQSVISRYLSTTSDPRFTTILRIVQALNINLSDLSDSPASMFDEPIQYESKGKRPAAKVYLDKVSSLTVYRNAEDESPIVLKAKARRK